MDMSIAAAPMFPGVVITALPAEMQRFAGVLMAEMMDVGIVPLQGDEPLYGSGARLGGGENMALPFLDMPNPARSPIDIGGDVFREGDLLLKARRLAEHGGRLSSEAQSQSGKVKDDGCKLAARAFYASAGIYAWFMIDGVDPDIPGYPKVKSEDRMTEIIAKMKPLAIENFLALGGCLEGMAYFGSAASATGMAAGVQEEIEDEEGAVESHRKAASLWERFRVFGPFENPAPGEERERELFAAQITTLPFNYIDWAFELARTMDYPEIRRGLDVIAGRLKLLTPDSEIEDDDERALVARSAGAAGIVHMIAAWYALTDAHVSAARLRELTDAAGRCFDLASRRFKGDFGRNLAYKKAAHAARDAI